MKIVLFLIILFTQSCALIFRDSRQTVKFKNGDENGVSVVSTPDGKFEIENGQGSFLMTRSKSDIQLKIKCSDGKIKTSIIETRFDGLSTIGDVLLFWPALFIDPFQDKFYNIPEVNLGCN